MRTNAHAPATRRRRSRISPYASALPFSIWAPGPASSRASWRPRAYTSSRSSRSPSCALIPAGIEALAGTAEAIPLPDASVDAVTVAQAFHWFDEERALGEIQRVLRPGGLLALVSNRREPGVFDEVLARHRAHPPLEEPPEGEEFPHMHRVESFMELAESETSIAILEGDDRAAALADFARLGGGELRYVTYVHIERL